MYLQLALDTSGPVTNLDFITGKVHLNLLSNSKVSHITVKLEGESRTRLNAPPPPGSRNDRPRPVLEIHKVRISIWKFKHFLANIPILAAVQSCDCVS
jgi:hypothetical protein